MDIFPKLSLWIDKVLHFFSTHSPIIPSFFDRLNHLNIQVDSFEHLPETTFIRIEKQLRARAKKSNAFEADANEKFLEALRTNGRAIDLILADDMLKHLVRGKKFKPHDFIRFMPADKTDLERVREFFKEYLEANLFEQFSERISKGDLKEIMVWHRSSHIFSNGFKQKLEKLLGSKLELIAETINARPPSYKLKGLIPFAKKKLFFQLLNEYKSQYLTNKLLEVLDAFGRNSQYTKGDDFLDSILFQMGEYDRENEHLHLKLFGIIMVAGGSNKVAWIAGLSIFGTIFLTIAFISYRHESKPPGPYVWPTDEWNARVMKDNYRQIENIPMVLQARLRRFNCDSLIEQLRNDPISKAGGITYTEDSTTNWESGRINSSGSEWNQPLAKTPGQSFMFVNRTQQELFLITYFFTCYYEKYKGIYPCKTPLAYCSIYVRPWDSLELSSTVLEHFYIQTGPKLRHWTGKVPYIKEDLGSSYAFCNARAQDSILLGYELKNKGKDRSQGGRLILEEVPKSFTLNWQGHSYAIFLENQKTYLKPFVPFDIKKKKKGA